jgi:phosphonate transport system substrate-binding protein
MTRNIKRLIFLAALLFVLVNCAQGEGTNDDKKLLIGGIPDQNVSLLEERFGAVADHLSNELGIDVEYVPVTDYSSLVTAFRNGDIMLGWFGGLTGVQAKSFTPGAISVAQRPLDKEFTSVFIVNSGSTASSLGELRDSSFTFGSTNSTSGHLMPRSFLLEAGIDPDIDFRGVPNFSGSHDLTWKLVESGSFDAGALNSAVWKRAVREGAVDVSKVHVIHETPAYVDYQWLAHPDIDVQWRNGLLDDLAATLIDISGKDEVERKILDSFETDSFVPVDPSDYSELEGIARSLNMLQ